MALVLPVLRLWLLLLNIYGTFKAMKPLSHSARRAQNKSGSSARAMQLRKRELKSCLAVWVVWSMFLTIESLLDITIGFVVPFYNELKCLFLLFLLIARARGAEAIFLHFIHPLLRPHVPAIDSILRNIRSLFDLFLLILLLPLEYSSHWWRKWGWSKRAGSDGGGSSDDHDIGSGGDRLPEERRLLRPRNLSQQAKMMEAERKSQAVLQNIEEAQNRVRARTQAQRIVHTVGDRDRNAPYRENQDADINRTVGLRTRKRVLANPPSETQLHGPGSSTTGVHFYRRALEELPPAPSLQPFTGLPNAPVSQPVPLPSNPLPIPPQPSTGSFSHKVWHPPRSAFEDDGRTPPTDAPQRTPSPLYPPLPSAYPFTPRQSDPLPPPPRIITPPALVTPTPRRVSTGSTSSRVALDAQERANRYTTRTNPAARPARTARSAEPPRSRQLTRAEPMQSEDFFGRALEPSIQEAEMDMETETISTRDDSSANENIDVEEDESPEISAKKSIGEAPMATRVSRTQRPRAKKGARNVSAPAEPLRRSTRRRNKSPSVETDEFGFTIRPGSNILGSKTTASSQIMRSQEVAPSKTKPLARTKPTLKATQEETSDEESRRKRQRLGPITDESATSDAYESAEADGEVASLDDHESISLAGGRNTRRKGNQNDQRIDESQGHKMPLPNRAKRGSKKQPISTKEDPHSVRVTKRKKGQ